MWLSVGILDSTERFASADQAKRPQGKKKKDQETENECRICLPVEEEEKNAVCHAPILVARLAPSETSSTLQKTLSSPNTDS